MKKSFVVTLLLTLISDVQSQSQSQAQKSGDSNFKISVSQGLTYNFNNYITAIGDKLDPGASKYTVNMTNFEAGFFISNHHEIGLSIGKNSFTVPTEYRSSFSYSQNSDTTYYTAQGQIYADMTWFAVYYNFHFLNTYKAGIKYGYLKPSFFESSHSTYINLSVGKYYEITKIFLIDLTLNYSNRSSNFEYFKSNQLGLSLGFNLRI